MRELVGHKTIPMTPRYASPSEAHKVAVVERLSRNQHHFRHLIPQGLRERAGDRGRTGDVQLGKLAFYH